MEHEKYIEKIENPSVERTLAKRAHVWVTLGKGENEVKVKALIDTGNTIREETAITEELHSKLNVGYEELGGTPIGTANKDGPKLRKYGISKAIEMQISGITGRFEIKPAVVATLSDRLNIGNGFLESVGRQIPVNVQFSKGLATLKIGSMTAELIRQMSTGNQMGTEQVNQEDHGKSQKSQVDQDITDGNPTEEKRGRGSRDEKKIENGQRRPREQGPGRRQQVYAIKELVCKANTVTFVEVQTERPVLEPKEVLIENDEHNQMETVEAIYSWKKDDNKIAVMNNSSIDLKILKNSSLGFIEEVKIDEEENEKQTKSYVEKINSITDEHRLQIVEDLGLNTNPVLKENSEIKKQAMALVMEVADIFGEK